MYKAQIADVLKTILDGQALYTTCPWIHLSTEEFTRARTRVSAVSDNEMKWPATLVTINRRIGNGTWNGALTRLGIETNAAAHSGGLRYSNDDYLRAIEDFLHICYSNFKYPSADYYEARRVASDWAYPSLAAIRLHFGTWTKALASCSLYSSGVLTHRWEQDFPYIYGWKIEEDGEDY